VLELSKDTVTTRVGLLSHTLVYVQISFVGLLLRGVRPRDLPPVPKSISQLHSDFPGSTAALICQSTEIQSPALLADAYVCCSAVNVTFKPPTHRPDVPPQVMKSAGTHAGML
jgi:hypothetical protein